jgi:uncharacterized membrane protein YkoI
MNHKHPKLLAELVAFIAMTGIAAHTAQAANTESKEAKELALFGQAKISLHDAIKAAEHKIGGKAMEAELNDESATVQFEVEVLKDGKIHEVIVDGISGKVLKVGLEDESKEGAEEGAENETK